MHNNAILFLSCVYMYVYICGFRAVTSLEYDNAMHVVYTVDRYSAPHFLLSVGSIRNYCSKCTVRVHAIVTGPSEDDVSRLMSDISQSATCFNESSISINTTKYVYNAPNTVLSESKRPHWFSETELVRLFVPEILPDLERFIYLDNDVIITKNGILNDLWKVNVGNATCGIVCNSLSSSEADKLISHDINVYSPIIQQLFNYSIKDDGSSRENTILRSMRKYPNSGVYVVNVTAWRDRKVGVAIRSLIERNMESNGTHLTHSSQGIIAAVLHNQWTELPQVFNLRPYGTHSLPALYKYRGHGILHFAGHIKPFNHCDISVRSLELPPMRAIPLAFFAHAAAYMKKMCPTNTLRFDLPCYYITNAFSEICARNPKAVRGIPGRWGGMFSRKCAS